MKLSMTGLRKQPFRTQGMPLVLVSYAAQKNAIKFLTETRANDRGLGLFHGPPLSGKTTILHGFAKSLPREHAVAIVDAARTDPDTLLKHALRQFGYDHGLTTAGERFNMMRVIAQQQAGNGHAPVLVIDNVHRMGPVLQEVVCELAGISNRGKSALRIILAGNESMLPVAEAPAMKAIEERLTGKFLLKPLTRTETAAYAHRKLQSGGCKEPKSVMPPLVCDRLHSSSGGWPGVIDRLAMMALANAERIPLEAEHIPAKLPSEKKAPNVVEPQPHMILTCKGTTLKRIDLDRPRLLIGRNGLSDIVIDHRWVSRHHAIVIRNNTSTVIVDLKSCNGVNVNGKRVRNHVLVNNDIISLGDHRLKFVDPSARQRTSLRGAGWDEATLARSISGFRKDLVRQLKKTS